MKEIGETEKEEEQKNLIITIITAVLAVVLFVGEAAASAAGLANDAIAIYDIINDSESAPITIFGMLLGAASLPRTPESFKEPGKLHLKMKEAGDLSRLGKVFEDAGKMNRILKTCK
ncbi:chitinase [Trichoderma arundinaceum]|uniref:Chitinase n=1 Tax=Trichoderma arundinaceum TaxID=490622 RepID=A0A395NKV3_TRIAR|nr:chitinase [Trichoderma arundinaceum]